MAAPIVVPRPVVRPSMLRSRASRSVVGATASCANPENTTSPMRVSASWFFTNSRTAASAAVSRLGETSVEHMEPDTSSARMIVESEIGTSMLTWGRAAATPSSASAASTSANGTCRFHAARLGAAARISATLECRTACLRRRRCCQT